MRPLIRAFALLEVDGVGYDTAAKREDDIPPPPAREGRAGIETSLLRPLWRYQASAFAGGCGMVLNRETEVQQVEAAYDAAWRAGDVEAIVACFTPDAVIVSPRGDAARGHRDIGRLLGEFSATEALGSRHSSEIVRVEFATDDVAVVDGEARADGLIDGSDEASVVHGFTDVIVRNDGRWAIAHVRAYDRRTSGA